MKNNKSSESQKSELVGYRHPPSSHQFKPGQSGNPAGRPKGARSLKTDLREELDEIIAFAEGGQALELSKQRLLVKRLVAAALDGNARAMATVLSLTMRAFGNDDRDDEEPSSEDSELLELFAPRQPKRRTKPNLPATSDDSKE